MKSRAHQACYACNSRRVRCHVVETRPCQNCKDQGIPCELRESRRDRYRRGQILPPQCFKTPDLRNTDKNDNNIIECAQEPTLHRDASSQENPLTQYTTQVPPPPSTPTVSAPECNSPTQTIRSTHVLHRKPDVLDEPSTSQQGHGTCKHPYLPFQPSQNANGHSGIPWGFRGNHLQQLGCKKYSHPPCNPPCGAT